MKKLLSILVVFALLSSEVIAQSFRSKTGIEPNAGTWKTWVIPSGNSFAIPPPPSGKRIKQELAEIAAAQSKADSAALYEMHHWNAGPAGYRWGYIADDLIDSTQSYLRVYALLNVAMYDATIAAWHHKYEYNRERPVAQSGAFSHLVEVPNSPSYPCEFSVASGAAATILAYLYPAKADSIMQLAKQAGQSRVLAGIQYPSDVEAGFNLGVQVAEYIIEHRAKNDGFDKKWPGKIPEGPLHWKGKTPKIDYPNCKPFVLNSTDQFRSVPPTDPANDMDELKAFVRTSNSNYRALTWEKDWPWAPLTDRLLAQYNWWDNPPRAARVYALLAIADHDNQLANLESKYTYFRIRPDQYDTTFVPLFKTPPSPGYPAGHATVAGSLAVVMAYLFPYDAMDLFEMADEEAESRFEGGVHFRSDNEAGLKMGKLVGEEIVKRAMMDGADDAGKTVNTKRK